ncbi:MAG: hypothetical protein ACREOO_18005 [bacterium]
MKLFQTKPFRGLIPTLCLLTLALAACQSNKRDTDDGSTGDTAASSPSGRHLHDQDTTSLEEVNDAEYNPTIDPANFATAIDNPYLTLTPGRAWIYEGKNEDGETERVEIAVTSDKKMILGVGTTVVREREWVEGELVEDTFDWFAQDKDGNVWYFGEDSREIDKGKVVSTKGSWEAGVNSAKPGIVMKANPHPGDAYRQEFLKGEAEDMGKVLGTDQSVSIGLGSYQNCLQIQDWTPLEPEVVEHKFYHRKIGNLILEKKVAGEAGQMELIEMRNEHEVE